MPRGYGMGRGTNWWHHGRGYCWPGYPVEYTEAKDLPKDVTYIGPCRCGYGPHAHYRTADGRIVHASSLPYEKDVTPSEPGQEHEDLQAELERLRNRVKDLETKLSERADTRRR